MQLISKLNSKAYDYNMAAPFGRDHSELDISGKDDGDAHSKMDQESVFSTIQIMAPK